MSEISPRQICSRQIQLSLLTMPLQFFKTGFGFSETAFQCYGILNDASSSERHKKTSQSIKQRAILKLPRTIF